MPPNKIHDVNKPAGGTRSQLGPQVSSRKASAPVYGFGSGTREGREKVFISQEHNSLVSGFSPGPIYDDVPAVGPQVNGALASAPMYGFGASTRDQMAKVYISAEHEKTTGGGPGVPGPGAYPIPSLTGGTQFNSTKHNLPRYGFGSSDRSHQAKVYISNEHNRTTDYGKDGPGKHYTVDSSVGKQMISGGPSPYASGGSEGIRNGTQPAWVLGKAERFEKLAKENAPGPGQYPVRAAVGTQVASTKASRPRYGFGTSNRDHMAKVYISADHDKLSGGRDAPGPGQYPIQSLTGKPVVAGLQKSGAKWGFGTSKRFTDAFAHQKGNPGPGQYLV